MAHLQCKCGSMRFVRPVMVIADKPENVNMVGQFEVAHCTMCNREYGFDFTAQAWVNISKGVRPDDFDRYART